MVLFFKFLLLLFFYPLFSPISWYPIVSNYYLVSSLQLPYRLRRDEDRKPCVLRNTTQPSRALLLNAARIQPGRTAATNVSEETLCSWWPWLACTAPGPPQESLVRDEPRISLLAKPSLTRTTLGQILALLTSGPSSSRPREHKCDIFGKSLYSGGEKGVCHSFTTKVCSHGRGHWVEHSWKPILSFSR